MVKVSISLPNNAQIIVESEEPDVIHEIVDIVLRDLPRDLMRVAGPSNGGESELPVTEKGSNVNTIAQPETAAEAPAPADLSVTIVAGNATERPEPAEDDKPKPPGPMPPEHTQESFTSGRIKAQKAALSAAAELAFIQLCQSINPLGDMRKVVVATEGASRFLEMDSVDAEDLGNLFDRVGWLHPHSFTQTLRNAARSKFRWLERVPGRAGRYTATDLGRATTLRD
ncbi:MAG: hypothetical protein IH962_03015 [Chloroflexi bacterium]|nr:hypothetical protein [Chloroflexota bacterium]